MDKAPACRAVSQVRPLTMRRWAACAVLHALLVGGASAGQLPVGFVYLREVAPDILQDIRYAGADNFMGRKVPGYDAGECILKRPVADALKKVQAELRRQSLGLKVYDCYRPARATKAFLAWMGTKSGPRTARYFPRVDRASLGALGYISSSSAHSRGLAVDASLIRLPPPVQPPFDPGNRYGPCTAIASERSPDNSIDMGTGFDCFDAMSHAGAAALSREQRDARALLHGMMRRHGFRGYGREWWHFTFPAGGKHGPALDFAIAPAPRSSRHQAPLP
jgi:zinc D-Ala-D-Ala dipeptidase